MGDTIERRGAFGRMLHNFANAILERARPRVLEWLRGRFGPSAELTAIELDGSRIHLIGAVVPLGDRLRLSVERATFLAGAHSLTDAVPLRLEEMRGTLVVPGETEPLFRAPIRLESDPGATGVDWVRGTLHLEGARWAQAHGEGAQDELRGAIRVALTATSWELTEGAFTAAAARVEMEASGSLGDEGSALRSARIDVRGARSGHYVDALLAISGKAYKLPLPIVWGAAIDGEVAYDASHGSRAKLELHTDASFANLAFRAAPDGRIEEAALLAQIGWADLGPNAIALIDATRSERITLSANATGSLEQPTVRASLAANLVFASGARGRLDGVATTDGAPELAVNVAVEHALGALRAVGTVSRTAMAVKLDGDLPASVVALSLARWARIADHANRDPLIVLAGDVTGWPLRAEISIGATDLALIGLHKGRTVELRNLGAELHADRSIEASAQCGEGTIELEHVESALRVRARGIAPDAIAFALDVFGLGHTAGRHDEADVWMRLPIDTRLDADVVFARGHATGTLEAKTPRTHLVLDMRCTVPEADWTGSVLKGHLAFEDAIGLGWFPTPIRPAAVGHVRGEIALEGAGDAFTMQGPLECDAMEVVIAPYPHVPPLALSKLLGSLDLDTSGMALRGVTGRALDGRFAVESAFPWGAKPAEGLEPWMQLQVAEASPDAVASWLTKALRLPAPLAPCALAAEVGWDSMGRFGGAVRLETARSRLEIEPRGTIESHMAGTIVRGMLGAADVSPQLPAGPVGLVPEGAIEIEGELDARGGLPLDASAKALGIRIGEQTRVELVAALATAKVHVDFDRAIWRDLKAHFYGGRMRSQGILGWSSTGFSGLQMVLEGVGVDVARVPSPDGERIGAYVTGEIGGALKMWRKPLTGDFTAQGELTIRSPGYPSLRRAAAMVSRYGLDAPDVRGSGPMTCSVRFAKDWWELDDLSAGTRDGDAHMRIEISTEGALRGEASVDLSQRYLRTSPILDLPMALIGGVTVPVRIGGTLRKPAMSTDLAGVFEGMIGESRVGRSITGVVERIFGDPEPQSTSSTRSCASEPLEALLDHVIDEDELSDAALDALIDRGLSPQRVADLIVERREARGR